MTLIGIDIGGTKTAAGLVAEDGSVLARAAAPTPATQGGGAVIGVVQALVEHLLPQSPDPVCGIGVGSAGVVDPRTGAIRAATSAIRSWAGTELRTELSTRCGLPVTVLNDVHAHAMAEARIGAGADSRRVMLLALGTGIGGAIVTDGRLDTGRTGAAGHFGHLPSAQATGLPCTCGGTGHLEAVASGPAVLEQYRRVTRDPSVVDTRAVFARAADGDDVATRVVDRAGAAIGEAIGGLVNSFDPDVVVVSGGLAYADPTWFDHIARTARTTMIPVVADCPITLSTLAGDAPLIGAALHHRISEETP
ncbi:ROK family protein [Curtobacterium sp. ZW137]|uniref:ROK family protein n=1 Tax=Curtobacterium sp. ZW137 TaxID=2485104 RepID=UPI000F4BF19C|nr:ROK family protein [Curtobacterium sp. ZW137]ROP61172.1 glucokinase [Curtobacterium sp. ZW137]